MQSWRTRAAPSQQDDASTWRRCHRMAVPGEDALRRCIGRRDDNEGDDECELLHNFGSMVEWRESSTTFGSPSLLRCPTVSTGLSVELRCDELQQRSNTDIKRQRRSFAYQTAHVSRREDPYLSQVAFRVVSEKSCSVSRRLVVMNS